MIVIGQYVYFQEGPIHHMDLECELSQAEGGGRCVRLYHNMPTNQQQQNFGQNQPPMPSTRDFHGQDAQTIRTNITRWNGAGVMTLLGYGKPGRAAPATEESPPNPEPARAGRKTATAGGRR